MNSITEYLDDNQIEKYINKYGIGNDEYIHCAYLNGYTLTIEILTDIYTDGELYIKTLELKPNELCEIVGHCCNYGTHDCPDCEKVFNKENN